MDVSYTVKITVPTEAKTPALALHEAGEKWNETKAKFEEIGGVEVVRVAPVIIPVKDRPTAAAVPAATNGEAGDAVAANGRGRRQAEPVGATAE